MGLQHQSGHNGAHLALVWNCKENKVAKNPLPLRKILSYKPLLSTSAEMQ